MTGATGDGRGEHVSPLRSAGAGRLAVRAVSSGALAAGILLAGIPVAAVSIPSSGADPARVVRVEMTEFAFRPALIPLAAGRPIRLVFTNRGQLAHQFQAEYLRTLPVRIADASALVEAPGAVFVRLEPAATAWIEFYPARRGRFVFACTIEGHREAGMRGILDVR